MYCAIKLSKGIQKDGNNENYTKVHNLFFNKHENKVLKKELIHRRLYEKVMNKLKRNQAIHITRQLCVKMVLQQNRY
jgi:hypothetical protein